MAKDIPVITIDGPSGSGKGTLSLLLARKLGWNFLDSGSLYRILAFSAMQSGLDERDAIHLSEHALKMEAEFVDSAEPSQAARIYLKGQDITEAIRTESCGNQASKLAALEPVRAALLERQREFCKLPGLVADGRDMGTVVFQNAPLKFFLHASSEERAKRRYLQLKEKRLDVNLQHLLVELNKRDQRDTTRAVAPLRQAQDALLIDTDNKSIEAVFNEVFCLVKEKLGGFI